MHLQTPAVASTPTANQHPGLAPLLSALDVDEYESEETPGELSDFWRRYRFEYSWLIVHPGISAFMATVLAARVASSQPEIMGVAGRAASFLAPFRARTPDFAKLQSALLALGLKAGLKLPEPPELAFLIGVWPLAVAVEALLASGGDDRLTLDPSTGLNRYGCAPWPRPEVIGFASCTASSLDAPQFLAAERARRRLIGAALAIGSDAALAEASASAANQISTHFGVSDIAEAILAASGTDAALIVTCLLAAEQPDTALTSILVSPAETGSGVPEAVQGRHFSTCTPSGVSVLKGSCLDGLRHMPRISTIALRDQNGNPCEKQSVADACESAIAAALPAGRVVLYAIDGSKTGLTAPDRPTLLRLARRFGRALDIIIDACQARVEPALVRWYLLQGFPVLVTGSKFFAAPGFCGAVLFPRGRLGRISSRSLPTGLASYTGLTNRIGSRHCPGLLLRWTAALHSMMAFGRLPSAEVELRLGRLGKTIEQTISRESRLHLVAAPRPGGLGWSDRRSVFTFMVRGEDGWLDVASLRRIYLAMHDDVFAEASHATLPCQVGQPVQVGSPTLGGLRLAISAAQICDDGDQARALQIVFSRLRVLLDRSNAAGQRAAESALILG